MSASGGRDRPAARPLFFRVRHRRRHHRGAGRCRWDPFARGSVVQVRRIGTRRIGRDAADSRDGPGRDAPHHAPVFDGFAAPKRETAMPARSASPGHLPRVRHHGGVSAWTPADPCAGVERREWNGSGLRAPAPATCPKPRGVAPRAPAARRAAARLDRARVVVPARSPPPSAARRPRRRRGRSTARPGIDPPRRGPHAPAGRLEPRRGDG